MSKEMKVPSEVPSEYLEPIQQAVRKLQGSGRYDNGFMIARISQDKKNKQWQIEVSHSNDHDKNDESIIVVSALFMDTSDPEWKKRVTEALEESIVCRTYRGSN